MLELKIGDDPYDQLWMAASIVTVTCCGLYVFNSPSRSSQWKVFLKNSYFAPL